MGGTTIGGLGVTLGLNYAGFTAGIGAVSNSVGGLVSKFSQLGKAGLAMAGISTVAAVISKAFTGFQKSEESLITFTALLGSADRAKAFKKELKDFGDLTPFGDSVSAAAKELLKFNVPSKEVVPILKQIGDIAAGVGTPLDELAGVIMENGYRANISSKQLISLSRMGVPIVQELSKTMGLSQGAVVQMANEGSLKFEHLMGAIKSATAEGGNFHGIMDASANTLGNLWGRTIDQIGDVFAKIGSVVGGKIESVFDSKGALGSIFEWLQEVEEGVANMGPWFDYAGLVIETFGEIWKTTWSGISTVFEVAWSAVSLIFTEMNDAVGGFRNIFVESFLAVKFVFQHFGEIMAFEWELLKVGLYAFGADVWHLFTVNIPEVLKWFGRNWSKVFTDLWNWTATVFSNLGENIWNIFKNLPGLIAGTVEWGDIWKPLTEGFKTSIEEGLALTKRDLTAWEKDTIAQAERMRAELAHKWTEFFAAGTAKFNFGPVMRDIAAGVVAGVAKEETSREGLGGIAAKAGKESERKYAGAYEYGSKEAYTLIAKNRDFDLARTTAKATEDTAKNTKGLLPKLTEIVEAVENYAPMTIGDIG